MNRTNPVSGARIKFLEEKLQGKLSPQEIQGLLLPLDPTATGEYLSWIVNILPDLRLPEDTGTIRSALERYHTLKQDGLLISEHRNIFNFKKISDLYQQLKKYETRRPKEEIATQPLKKLRQIEEFEIFQIQDADTLQKLSRDTRWCTSNEDLANSYLRSGPVLLVMRNKKKYAMMHCTNYSFIYQEYLNVKEKIGQLLHQGINPFATDGSASSPIARPELRPVFQTPVLELVTGNDIRLFNNKRLLSAREYYSEIADRNVWPVDTYALETPSFQFRDTFDDNVKQRALKVILPWALKYFQPTDSDSLYYYNDYLHSLCDYLIQNSLSPSIQKIIRDTLISGIRKLRSKNLDRLADSIEFIFNYPGAYTGAEKQRHSRFLPHILKEISSWTFKDLGSSQRIYQSVQKHLSSDEKVEFETRLRQLHRVKNFTWPACHYLEYYLRINLEIGLTSDDGEIENIEEIFQKEERTESNYLKELGLQHRDVTLEVLRDSEGQRKQKLHDFKTKIAALRQSWKFFQEKVKSSPIDDPDLFIQVIGWYRKSKLLKLDFPRKKSEDGYRHYNYNFGPVVSKLWELPYIIYDSRPTLDVVIQGLADVHTPFGMIKHKGQYLTPEKFLQVILRPQQSSWSDKWKLRQKREHQAALDRQQELIARVEKELRTNPLVGYNIPEFSYILRQFYTEVYDWLHDYGLGTRGFTIIDPTALRRHLSKQIGESKTKKLLPPGLIGALLVTCRSYDNLCNLMQGKKEDSAGFRKIRRRWLREDTLADRKMAKVKEILHREFNQIAEKFNYTMKPLPLIFKPEDPHHYKAKEYICYPIYLNS